MVLINALSLQETDRVAVEQEDLFESGLENVRRASTTGSSREAHEIIHHRRICIKMTFIELHI